MYLIQNYLWNYICATKVDMNINKCIIPELHFHTNMEGQEEGIEKFVFTMSVLNPYR